MSHPSTTTPPSFGRRMPDSTLSKVVLPLPDGPTMYSISPKYASRLTPRSADVLAPPSPNHLTTRVALTAGGISGPEGDKWIDPQHFSNAQVARHGRDDEHHHKRHGEVPVRNRGGVTRQPQLRRRDQECAQADPQTVSGQRCEDGLKQEHQDQIAALGSDGFERAEAVEILEDERIE